MPFKLKKFLNMRINQAAGPFIEEILEYWNSTEQTKFVGIDSAADICSPEKGAYVSVERRRTALRILNRFRPLRRARCTLPVQETT